ncbi:uncharacterized protein BKCO1_600043 [Diplodia corticola]|uniref:Uncharacterized protein n=1 Tax=Diplodia corticola TaxID=236234 RepID=A0A1J9RYC7_9PEZI|nr:uncharacterized protein BKCO1_600043 [Diplodia corticola]OJD37667.1 hypothetical protein BKCO1_600043 [Diplodia corticola]
MSSYSKFGGENPYEESQHFHWKPQGTVTDKMVWVLDRYSREKAEAKSKMAKLDRLLEMTTEMFDSLVANPATDTPDSTEFLQTYYLHVHRARSFYHSVTPSPEQQQQLLPHDTRERRLGAAVTDTLHSFPAHVPGRSNAGLVEESLRDMDRNAMRGRCEAEAYVAKVLGLAPVVVGFWRGVWGAAAAEEVQGEKKKKKGGGGGGGEDGELLEVRKMEAMAEKMEGEAKGIAEVEGLGVAESAAAVAVQGELGGGGRVAAEQKKKKVEEVMKVEVEGVELGVEGPINSVAAVADPSPAEEESAGWMAKLVVGGDGQAKTV